MKVAIDASSFRAIPNIFRNLQGRSEKSMEQAAAALAMKIRTTAVDLIQKGPKSGRVYGEHQASAPGEAPASNTGDLARSIRVVKGEEKTWFVVARVPYASYLEFGTEYMEPRPFMTPAFVQALPNLKDEIWKAWKAQKDSFSSTTQGE